MVHVHRNSRYNSTIVIMDRDDPWDSSNAAPLVSMSRLLPSSEEPGMITWEIARNAKQKETKIRTTKHTVYSMATGQKLTDHHSSRRGHTACSRQSMPSPCRCLPIAASARAATHAAVTAFVFSAKSA